MFSNSLTYMPDDDYERNFFFSNSPTLKWLYDAGRHDWSVKTRLECFSVTLC